MNAVDGLGLEYGDNWDLRTWLNSGFFDGWSDGAIILADTASLGNVNHDYAKTLQGGVYDVSRTCAYVGVGSLALASGGAILEASPALYVASVNAAYNPWTYVAVGGALSGAQAYNDGGSAGDVLVSAVAGGGMTYISAPFPIGGRNAPPIISQRYQRPSGATTPQQRASVQGKPCVTCGGTSPVMVADHKLPLVKEYYLTGKINLQDMKDISCVQPQCSTCSAKQGAELRLYSIEQAQKNGL
jgi:hypothetical protein